MKKKAHIAAGPAPAVGDETIGLCGKVFTVEVLWGDVPKKHPICRNCVNVAIEAAAEADHVIRAARRNALVLRRGANMLADTLYPEDDLTIDVILEQRQDWQAEQEQQQRDAEAEQAAAETCTCRWVDGVRVDNPVCRIHGADDEEATEDES